MNLGPLGPLSGGAFIATALQKKLLEPLFGGDDRYGQREAVQSTKFRDLGNPQAQSAYNSPDGGSMTNPFQQPMRPPGITDGNPQPAMGQPPPMMGKMGMAPSTMPMQPMGMNMNQFIPSSPMAQFAKMGMPMAGGMPGMMGPMGMPGQPQQPMPNMGTNAAGTMGMAKPMYGAGSPANPGYRPNAVSQVTFERGMGGQQMMPQGWKF